LHLTSEPRIARPAAAHAFFSRRPDLPVAALASALGLWAGLAAVQSCADSTGPLAHVGRYSLVGIDGESLPVTTVNPYVPCGQRVLGGYARLTVSTLEYSISREQLHSSGARAPIPADTARLRYALAGTAIQVQRDGNSGPLTIGSVGSGTLTLQLARATTAEPIPDPECPVPQPVGAFAFTRDGTASR
jgi:hypothetical protein